MGEARSSQPAEPAWRGFGTDAERDGRIEVVKMRLIARLGYTDYSVVDDLFSMPRPAKPADERGASAHSAILRRPAAEDFRCT
jgi:hypothetical protein